MSYVPSKEWLEKFMRESNFIEGEHMVANPHDSAYEPWIIGRLNDHDIKGAQFFLANDVNVTNLKKTHRILFHGSGERWGVPENKWVGQWKPVPNQIGNHHPPPPERIPDCMKAYMKAFPDMDAFEAHNEFANIHPFMDGNGRMCRLVWLWKSLYDESNRSQLSFLHNYYYETLNHQNSRSKFT